MPNDESPQPKPNAESKPANRRRQTNRISKGHAELVGSLVGIVTLILGAISTVFFDGQHWIPGLFLTVAFILAAIIPTYYLISFHLKQRLVWGFTPVAITGTASALFGLFGVGVFVFPLIFPASVPPPPKPFVITPGVAWDAPRISYALTPSALGRLAIGIEIPGELILKPIDWMVYVTLANNQDIPTTIEGYRGFFAESNNPSGPWLPLCEVALDQGQIFFLYNHLKDVSILATSKSLDTRLIEHTIAPHESISGWIAFESPNGAWSNLTKLQIREANGRVSETDPFPLASTETPLNNYFPEPLAIHQDLTSQKIDVQSSCEAPGTTGLSLFFPQTPGK